LTGNIVARRYARALFAIGETQGKEELAAYGKGLAELVDVLEGAPELFKVFRNPVFSVEEKKAVLDKVLDRVKPVPMVKNFCFLLADKDRLAFLPDIQVYFNQLLDMAQGVVRGEMVTAIDLADELKQEVVEQLEKQSGRKIILDYSVDPEILGGLVLKVGDKVLDASIRAQIEILKENIKRGE